MASRKSSYAARERAALHDLAASTLADPAASHDDVEAAARRLAPREDYRADRLAPHERRALRYLLSKASGTPRPGDEYLSVELHERSQWPEADLAATQGDLAALPIATGGR